MGKMLLEAVQQLCTAFQERHDYCIVVPTISNVRANPAVAAYRAYYRAEKRGHWRKSRDPAKSSTWVPAKWTRRDPPEWFSTRYR